MYQAGGTSFNREEGAWSRAHAECTALYVTQCILSVKVQSSSSEVLLKAISSALISPVGNEIKIKKKF